MAQFPHARRLDDAREALRDRGARALVCPPGPNARYLVGLTGTQSERPFLLALSRDDPPAALVPELEAATARAAPALPDGRLWTWGDDEAPEDALRSFVADVGLDAAEGDLLVDDRLWARHLLALRDAVGAPLGLASDVCAPLRVRKDDAELDCLRRAATIADRVVERLRERGADVVGTTERALAREVERLLADEGGEGSPFDPVVAAGENGANPHHEPGERVVEAGEPVVLDFGTLVDGYPSDQTRTLCFGGPPDERVRDVHDVVREAQAAGVDAVEPGVPAGAVDAAARTVVESAGYGDAFVHRTGHGVGLEVHEEPFVSRSSDRVLEPGMVFSVEPGVYLDGAFGVRVEDLVVVTADGCERLNQTARGWGSGDREQTD
ncbi:MAG: M24 family metallopeptidase [Haloferacaceae archaeon]